MRGGLETHKCEPIHLQNHQRKNILLTVDTYEPLNMQPTHILRQEKERKNKKGANSSCHHNEQDGKRQLNDRKL